MPFTIAKINEAGAITNPDNVNTYVRDPFDFTDVFISSHGWWTTPDGAEQEYTDFRDGLLACFETRRTAPGLRIPQNDQILAVGIEWPAMVSDSLGPFDNIFEAFSYYEIRGIAEWVANTGVTGLIRKIWSFAEEGRQLNIHILGHSMGCRVACQALSTALLADSRPMNPNDLASAPLVRILPNIRLNVTLFEGAIDNNTIDRLQKYGVLSAIDGLRIMVTCSDLDAILKSYPPDDQVNPAMGAKGPTAGTFTDPVSHFYDQQGAVGVGPGSVYSLVADIMDRFIVADLTELHKADRSKDPNKWGGIGGSHSDIFEPAIYELVTGFLFGDHGGAHPA